jgi:WD40 repeat protein
VFVSKTVNFGTGCALPSILVDHSVRNRLSYAASSPLVRSRCGCEPLNHFDRISKNHVNLSIKCDPNVIFPARLSTPSRSCPRRKSPLIHTPSVELPRRASMSIVVSLLFGLQLVPICSQSICAQQSSPTAPPSVAADDLIKSRVESPPSLLRQRYTLGLDMSYPSSVSFSPDNLRVITANQDNIARLWDADSNSQTYGKLLRTLEGHTSGVSAASFSPDGKYVVTGSLDNTARLWDVDPNSPTYGKALCSLEGHTDGLYCASFSPQGQWVLTGGRDNAARLWDVDPNSQSYGKLLRTLRGHKLQVVVALFSPDGTRVLTGSNDNTVRLWDPESQSASFGKEFQGIGVGKTGYVLAASFSPDGRSLLAGSADNTARLFDADPNSATYGKIRVTLRGHTGWLRAASFSPDGKRILTGSDDKTARLWDVEATSANFGSQIALVEAGQPITSADFSPEGSRVVVSAGTWNSDPAKSRGEVQIWNLAE